MMSPTQQAIVQKLASISELSPGIRFGQMLTNLEFLADDAFDRGMGEISDDQLLKVLEHHEAELTQRHSNVA